MTKLSDELKTIREFFGLQIEELAHVFGTSEKYIHELEDGSKRPSYKVFYYYFCKKLPFVKEEIPSHILSLVDDVTAEKNVREEYYKNLEESKAFRAFKESQEIGRKIQQLRVENNLTREEVESKTKTSSILIECGLEYASGIYIYSFAECIGMDWRDLAKKLGMEINIDSSSDESLTTTSY